MARRSRWGRCSSWAVSDSPSTRDAAARHEPALVSQPGHTPLPLYLAPQKRELARGQGKPPSVRREYVDGHRTFPKDDPGVVGRHGDGNSSCPFLSSLSPHLFLSSHPFLPFAHARASGIGVSPPRCRRRTAAPDRGGVSTRRRDAAARDATALRTPLPSTRPTVPVCTNKKQAQTIPRRDLNRRPLHLTAF